LLHVSLGQLNKQQTVNKPNFLAVLSHAIDDLCFPARIKAVFRKTGMPLLNADAIDKSKLAKSHKETIVRKRGVYKPTIHIWYQQ
jgi:hypothetical protein